MEAVPAVSPTITASSRAAETASHAYWKIRGSGLQQRAI
jgi:hypothetical protein